MSRGKSGDVCGKWCNEEMKSWGLLQQKNKVVNGEKFEVRYQYAK